MRDIAALTGRLAWHLRSEGPVLINERPDLVETITRGRPAHDLPGLLSALFSMCGHAHRLTAQRAVAAALGQDQPLDEGQQIALQQETLREHLRRIWLDWPRLLGGPMSAQISGQTSSPPPGLLKLASCPILRPDQTHRFDTSRALVDPMQALTPWLEEHVFQQPIASWLQAWQADGEQALAAWAAKASTMPALLIEAAQSMAQSTRLPFSPWPSLGSAEVAAPACANSTTLATSLAELAEQLATVPGTARQPTWHQHALETGPWSRLHDPVRLAPGWQDTPRSLWWRMGARLADIARLALPDDAHAHHGRHWLQGGTQPLGPGAALAWTEMARGVLLHRVQLDTSEPSTPKVASCQVVSPTDWNFHPGGVVAHVLDAIPFQDEAHRLRLIPLIVAAYDPCVPLVVMNAQGQTVLACPPEAGAPKSDDKRTPDA
jgi:hypothetical protein